MHKMRITLQIQNEKQPKINFFIAFTTHRQEQIVTLFTVPAAFDILDRPMLYYGVLQTTNGYEQP